nr:DUF4157 domain-containing protein [uncultured Thiodictyon sp.]
MRRRTPDGDAPGVDPAGAPPVVHAVLNAPGQPLDRGARAFFEPRLDRDLGDVRIHTDGAADRSALAVGAQAYAVGRHIAFAPGRYAPDTQDGRYLLGHELAHTIQQGASAPTLRRAPPPTPATQPATVPTPGPTDFVLNRVGASTTARISFAPGSAALDAGASAAIVSIKALAPASLRLIETHDAQFDLLGMGGRGQVHRHRDFVLGVGDQMHTIAEPTLDLVPGLTGARVDPAGRVFAPVGSGIGGRPGDAVDPPGAVAVDRLAVVAQSGRPWPGVNRPSRRAPGSSCAPRSSVFHRWWAHPVWRPRTRRRCAASCWPKRATRPVAAC